MKCDEPPQALDYLPNGLIGHLYWTGRRL
jgi:hypothetical protein